MQNLYELHCNYKYIYEKIRHGIDLIIIESALKTKPISGGSGEGPEEPAPPFFLDQTEARGAEKKFFFETWSPARYLRVWMTGPPLSEGLDPPLPMHHKIDLAMS